MLFENGKLIVRLLIIAFVPIACTMWASRKIKKKNRRRSLLTPYFVIVNLFPTKESSLCTQYANVSTAARDYRQTPNARALITRSWRRVRSPITLAEFRCALRREKHPANHKWRPDLTSKIKTITRFGNQRKNALFHRTDKSVTKNRCLSSPLVAEITAVNVDIRSCVRYPKISFFVIPHLFYCIISYKWLYKLKKEIKESSSPVIAEFALWYPFSAITCVVKALSNISSNISGPSSRIQRRYANSGVPRSSQPAT